MSKRPAVPTGQPDQLSFAFPAGRMRFQSMIITPANQSAIKIVRQTDKWPMPVICLTGPKRCGLTSILQAWCDEGGGTYLSAQEFSRQKARKLEELAHGLVAVDDADKVAESEKLLSLINRIGEEGGRLLLAATSSPSQWPVTSADLKSRLNSMPIAQIHPPDEAMLIGRLQAAAARHFLRLGPDIIAYLSTRLDLTYEAIEAFAERLSDGVTTTGRAPSVPLAKEVLEAMGLVVPDEPPAD